MEKYPLNHIPSEAKKDETSFKAVYASPQIVPDRRVVCRKCGCVLELGDNFCYKCGTSVKSQTDETYYCRMSRCCQAIIRLGVS